MNRVEIIAIGNEILTGRVLDSNSNWLAKAFTAVGGEVTRCVVVRDVVDEIVREVQNARANKARIIITTGGLGPTFDDRTLEAVAQALDRPLVLHADALEWIIQKYEDLKREGYVDSDDITPSREKMAHVPDDSIPLPNTVGAAPGVMIELKGCTLFCLPGVPAEMKAIFEEHVEEKLRSIFGSQVFIERNITTDVSDESKIVPIIEAVMKEVEGVYLKSKPTHFGKDVRIGVRITASGEDETELKERLERTVTVLEVQLKRKGHLILDHAK
ncbi:MAG: competence/damage-inducible protein A [Gemmatimonadota bacterium]|nr:MAG: competence/damage-inducible protein A [Gemmatimonadota bacterium]